MLFTNLVQANLKTRILGRQIEYYTRLESTNSEAWEIIAEGTPSGTLVVTDNQFSGRGRSDRKWFASPDKSLTFSVILYPRLKANLSGWLPILTGIAVQKTLLQFHTSLKLKWPNDLILKGKKLGGILCESKVKSSTLETAVIGIGLNVNEATEDMDEVLKSSATSMHITSGKFYQRERILAEILNELETLIDELPENTNVIQSEWEAACGHMNEEVRFHNGDEIVRGIFKSLGESGSAILEIDGKQVEYHSGEIQ